jgi:hypothetical protein
MNCSDAGKAIEGLTELNPAQRAELHRHLAECAGCGQRFDARLGLDAALGELAMLRSQRSPTLIGAALLACRRQRQREFVLAVVAALLCALAAVGLQTADASFARLALPAMAVVFALQAWRSLRAGARFLGAAGSDAGPAQWTVELRHERRLIRYAGPLVAMQFALLTAFAIHLHGLSDPRIAVYLLTASGLVAYVAWKFSRRLPQIEREIALLTALRQ